LRNDFFSVSEALMKISILTGRAAFILAASTAVLIYSPLHGQTRAGESRSDLPRPVTFTAQQDHQNMMKQLGIKALRPAPTPKGANYDESKANPYPNLPDALRPKDGQKVTSSEA
jgi:hypothetical protein